MSTPLTSADAAKFTQAFVQLRFAPVQQNHLRPKTVEDVLAAVDDIRQMLVHVADEGTAKDAELASHARMFGALRDFAKILTTEETP